MRKRSVGGEFGAEGSFMGCLCHGSIQIIFSV